MMGKKTHFYSYKYRNWPSKSARKKLKRKNSKENIANGFYKTRDLSVHSAYHSLGMDYAGLGRAYCLNNEELIKTRQAFSTAGQQVLYSLEMAYNPIFPDYIGDKPKRDDQIDAGFGQVDWSAVIETFIIDGFNWALMGKDFATAESIATWYQDSPDGYKMDPDVNRYVYAYKYLLLNQPQNALPLLNATVDLYNAMPPKTNGDVNYFLMSIIMQGIALNNAHQVNESLLMYLDFYLRAIIPAEDYWDTSYEFIADPAIALANLAIHRGIEIRIQHDLLPQQLIR